MQLDAVALRSLDKVPRGRRMVPHALRNLPNRHLPRHRSSFRNASLRRSPAERNRARRNDVERAVRGQSGSVRRAPHRVDLQHDFRALAVNSVHDLAPLRDLSWGVDAWVREEATGGGGDEGALCDEERAGEGGPLGVVGNSVVY